MSSDIKHKAISSTIWSSVERFSTQIAQFVITLIMARILTPGDYGMIGMLSIFMSLSQVFIDGGFSSALIQRKDRSERDFSTVFYINLGVSILLYWILWFASPLIARFYNQALLEAILKVYALTLIINSLVAINKTILSIRLDFKTLSKISFFSALISGIVGIASAYLGYGVWALVIQSIAMGLCNVGFALWWVRWLPHLSFSIQSFHKLFGFGSKLLVATIISSVYDNLYSLVIGKKFEATQLGYYSRALSFTSMVSLNISAVLNSVSYPLLSQVQDSTDLLLNVYRKYIHISSFIIFPLLMLLCGIAEPMVRFLLTDKWIGCVPILQILCFSNMWVAIIQINLNLLKVRGLSNLVLRLEIIKKTIAITILAISLLFNSLVAVCLGLVIYSLISVVLNTYYTGKLFQYPFLKQFKDFGPYLIPSVLVLLTSLISSHFISHPLLSLVLSGIVGGAGYLFASNILKLPALHYTMEIIKDIKAKR